MALNRLFASLYITPTLISRRSIHVATVNFASKPNIEKPKPGFGKSFRRIVHFPEEYTVKPLEVTNLAGRDPVSGRVIAKGIGGGIKHKYHWIDWYRNGPTEGPPQEEKVIQVMEDGCRTANIALVAVGDKLKYILASENMKAGDIIKTSRELPRIPENVGPVGPVQTRISCLLGTRQENYSLRGQLKSTLKEPAHCTILYHDHAMKVPCMECIGTGKIFSPTIVDVPYMARDGVVRANEGDAYLLGALPAGTVVHCIEKEPGMGGLYIHAAGTFGTILRKQDDRVIVQMPSKRQFSFDQKCMAVVGRLSNILHGSTPIGSPQRNRWLGNRPRSGLWQRKTGRHGRKIKPPKPVKEIHLNAKPGHPAIKMNMHH